MSRILIYSDPHLALIRGANTSISSSIRLRDTLQNQSERVATDLRQELECDKVFCLGDLFHTYSNSEEMIQSAAKTVQNTDIILAGNHDLENKAGSIGSLQLLSSLNAGGKFLINELGEADSFHVEHGNTDFLFVPHAANQELFETAIADAKEFAQNSSKWRVLCLHCNYDLTREGMPDTSLNLLSDKAKDLLSVFHFIFLGHEHNPEEYYDGRLVIVGNTHPTGFSDISDKRVLVFDTDAGTYESHTIWENNTFVGSASEAPVKPTPFMDITDDLPVGEANKLVTKLFRHEASLAIRLRSSNKQIEGERLDAKEIESLSDMIDADLKKEDPELHQLWLELLP